MKDNAPYYNSHQKRTNREKYQGPEEDHLEHFPGPPIKLMTISSFHAAAAGISRAILLLIKGLKTKKARRAARASNMAVT